MSAELAEDDRFHCFKREWRATDGLFGGRVFTMRNQTQLGAPKASRRGFNKLAIAAISKAYPINLEKQFEVSPTIDFRDGFGNGGSWRDRGNSPMGAAELSHNRIEKRKYDPN